MNNKWFVIPKPNINAELKLICFPYAGGSVSTFLPWVKTLPANVELIIIQAPGRGVNFAGDTWMTSSRGRGLTALI